jgi:hypothetical protein
MWHGMTTRRPAVRAMSVSTVLPVVRMTRRAQAVRIRRVRNVEGDRPCPSGVAGRQHGDSNAPILGIKKSELL